MYGRSFYDVWVKKYGIEIADEKLIKFKEKIKIPCTKEAKKQLSIVMSGKNNPMYGRSFYDVWVKKYGIEIADEKLIKFKEKKSKASSGKNNPMYGKPSPQGSGNGWSGWYKQFFFRSLLELSFLKLMNDSNIKIVNAETQNFKVKYYNPLKKIQANYFPDYYLPEFNLLIEIKPKNLINTYLNNLKFMYMKRNFVVITDKDFKKLKKEKIKQMYLDKDIIFTKRYEKKFKDRYL